MRTLAAPAAGRGSQQHVGSARGASLRNALKVSAIVVFCASVCLFSAAYTGLIDRNTALSWLPSAAAAKSSTNGAKSSTTVTRIPVLLYHGIVSPKDKAENSVTLEAFQSQMSYLHAEGYQTISPLQYVQWSEGKHPALPPKPILITFDCNQTSALLTQKVLEKYGFRPVMYVVSGFADHGYGDYYMTWDGLRTLASEGWYIQFHAGPCGHGYITIDTPFNCDYDFTFKFTGSAKIGHRYYSQKFGQSAPVYHARVERDVAIGMEEISTAFRMPESQLHETFAVPWSDYGQPQTSNIPWLGRYFAREFSVVFIQNNYPAMAQARKLRLRYRFEVDDPTTMKQFIVALRDPRFAVTS
jgi:hypothetical protein